MKCFLLHSPSALYGDEVGKYQITVALAEISL